MLKPRVEKGNNGEYWVNKIQNNMERDSEIDKRLLFLGWTLCRITSYIRMEAAQLTLKEDA